MIEIKIRFKSGEIGWFKYEDKDIDDLFETIGNAIRDNNRGVLEVIDLADDKKTIVNIGEIVSFGYSLVTE